MLVPLSGAVASIFSVCIIRVFDVIDIALGFPIFGSYISACILTVCLRLLHFAISYLTCRTISLPFSYPKYPRLTAILRVMMPIYTKPHCEAASGLGSLSAYLIDVVKIIRMVASLNISKMLSSPSR